MDDRSKIPYNISICHSIQTHFKILHLSSLSESPSVLGGGVKKPKQRH